MRTLPPLTALRAFEAAARLLSFKDAAKELTLTPTAISHQVRLLEDYCGKPLFQRRPRPLSLTVAGARLLPAISQGLDLFAEGLALATNLANKRLRVTATNAFAVRWIMPNMPSWLAIHPDVGLDIMGTDEVLDLAGGAVDIAIRYSRQPPKGVMCSAIGKDAYILVASPALVGTGTIDLSPQDLLRFPLIDGQWSDDFLNPPMWFEWARVARAMGMDVPNLEKHAALSFREDLHGIEAAVAGYGIAICSDVLVARDLINGTLVRVSTLALEGFTFYAVHRLNDPRQDVIQAFESWLSSHFRLAQITHAPEIPSK
ncbi:MAG: LysR substrate-binding domain-containing protein [bacterium]